MRTTSYELKVRSPGTPRLRAFVFASLPFLALATWLVPDAAMAQGPAPSGESDTAEPPTMAAPEAAPEPEVEPEPEPESELVPGEAPDANTSPSPPIEPTFTDLGTIRYVDPHHRREIWLGLDVGGAWVPESLGLFPRTLWTVRLEPAYAVAATEWLTIGGRHGLIWYDAENIRARYHHHELELSGRPTAASKKNLAFTDRLAFRFEHHALRVADLEGDKFKLGGVLDTVVQLGYGMRHEVHHRVDLDWNLAGRYVWLFEDTQRQVRASFRVIARPKKRGHQFGVEVIGYLIHRDAMQFGNPLERVSPEGQAAVTYEYMSRKGLGLFTKLRVTSSLFTGEAPVYEVREEALNNVYAEAALGFRWAWH